MPTLECVSLEQCEENGETMKWLNFLTATWSREEYVGCKPLDRATWHSLMFYCAVVENGGRIPGCKQWSNGKCEQTLKLKRRELLRNCTLWRWEGDDLIVWEYPVGQEKTYKNSPSSGRTGGVSSGKSRREGSENGRPPSTDPSTPPLKGHAAANLTEPNLTEPNQTQRKNRRPGFPESLEEAINAATKFDRSFVEREWHEAKERGGCDYKGRTIRNWNGYLGVQLAYRGSNPAPAQKANTLPLWRRLKACEDELKEVKDALNRLPQFNPNVHPAEFEHVEKTAAPLRERRDELKRRIAAIHQQQEANQ